jgi:hypothetical protein
MPSAWPTPASIPSVGKIRLFGTGKVFGSSKDIDDQRGTGRVVEYGWREPAVQVPGERPEWDERCPSQSRHRFNETSVSPTIRDGSKKKRPVPNPNLHVPNPNLHPALFWVRSSPCSADFQINKIAALRLDCSELPQKFGRSRRPCFRLRRYVQIPSERNGLRVRETRPCLIVTGLERSTND